MDELDLIELANAPAIDYMESLMAGPAAIARLGSITITNDDWCAAIGNQAEED